MLRILLFFLLVVSSQITQAQNPLFQWSRLLPLPDSLGVAGAFVGVHNDVLIIAGGANFPKGLPWEGGEKIYHNSIYVMERNGVGESVWLPVDTTKLPENIAYGASVSTTNGIVCVGGENDMGIQKSVFLIEWHGKYKGIRIKNLPDLPISLTNCSIANIGETIYVMGGSSDGKFASDKGFTIRLNESNARWESIPDMPVGLTHASAVAQSNGISQCIYVMGGRRLNSQNTTEVHKNTYCFDPNKRIWTTKSAIGSPNRTTELSAGSAISSGSNYVVLFSGDNGEMYKILENYSHRITKSKDEVEKEVLIREKNSILNNHKGFSRSVYYYNTVTDVWAETDEIPSHGQVTTTAVKWGDKIIIPSGEIRPGIRTPVITEVASINNQMFSWVDSVVLLICFLLMTLGRYFFTGSTSNTEDYFKGGKRIPQWAAAVSIFGAKLSAITFMGIPAKAYATNWTYFFYLMTIVMVMPFVARYFIPFYRRLNVTSAYEYLGLRFNTGTRLIASTLFILLQLGRMGIVVLLPSIALTLVTGIDINICILSIGIISIFFTVKGGIEAVIWVEVIQVIILACGAVACLVYIPFQLNDWNGGVKALSEADKLKVFDLRFDFTEPTIWVVVIGGLAIHLLTYGTDQTTVQRYLTTKTEQEAVNSLKLGAWLSVPSSLVFFSIGTLLYMFFRENPSEVNIALNNQDNILPWFIVSQLPVGLSGLLIAGIFAASMSSTEASMNSTATLLTTDFYSRWQKNVTEKQNLFFARLATFVLGIFVTAISLFMAHQGVSSLWDKFNTILGLFTGCIGGAFILGLFTRRANGIGVILGMIISCITQVLIQQYTQVHLLMYAFLGLVSCVILGYIFSILFPQPGTGEKYTIYNNVD